MKNKILATTTVLAALMGTSQNAYADACDKQFTLIEELAPALRQKVSAELTEMMKYLDIDWESIVAGVNETEEFALEPKLKFNVNRSLALAVQQHQQLKVKPNDGTIFKCLLHYDNNFGECHG